MVTLQAYNLLGAFVFDMDVNDAVRLLKKDKATDVRLHVSDIQTFPMNEEKSIELNEFIERISEYQKSTNDSIISDQEEQEVEK